MLAVVRGLLRAGEFEAGLVATTVPPRRKVLDIDQL
jgi:hypothetical protein